MNNNKNQQIESYVNKHHQAADRLAKLVRTVVEKLEKTLKKRGILARVSGRVKTPASLSEKLTKWTKNDMKLSQLKQDGVFSTVGDLAAVRVMTYVEEDRSRVAEIAKSIFTHRYGKQDFEAEEKEKTSRIKGDETNFYRATHMQIKLKSEDLMGDNDNLKDDHCELQITSMFAHVWNEIEHDIAYKANKAELSDSERSALESLGLLTKSGDNIVMNLISANKDRIEKKRHSEQTFENAETLSRFLKKHFGNYKIGHTEFDFEKNAWTLLKALKLLKKNHPAEITQIITPSLLQQAIQKTKTLETYMKKKNYKRNNIESHTCDCIIVGLLDKNFEVLEQSGGHGGDRLNTILGHYRTNFV